MPLSGHSVGTYPETSSQATCQERIGHSRLSSLNHCGLILTLRVELARANFHLKQRKKQTDKQKSAGGEWVVERSPQTFASDEKAATTMQHVTEQGMWVFFQK